jgi:hypothetical protein
MQLILNSNMELSTNLSENNTEHFRQGIETGKQSEGMRGILQNPYPRETPHHNAWSLGWCKGYANGLKEVV